MSATFFPRRFENQTVIVTGGCQGIGFAIAQRLLQEDARVWIFDRNAKLFDQCEEQFGCLGLRAKCLEVDITSSSSVANGFSQVLRQGGAVTGVINSAGVVGPNGMKSGDVPLEEFQRTCQVNLFGSFIVLQEALRSMLPRNYGRILLIASIAGKEGNPGMAAYSASKAGVIGLVKSAGKEYAETGLTINAIAPATIQTAMVEAMEKSQVDYMLKRIPMQRCGLLEEIASLATWIISPECSFTTGFTFDLSGGRAVY